jgi:hypothetical protein
MPLRERRFLLDRAAGFWASPAAFLSCVVLPMAANVVNEIKQALGDEECACLDRVLQRTPALIQLAKQCEDCGWDVSAARGALEEQQAIATKAKAAFFPNRS